MVPGEHPPLTPLSGEVALVTGASRGIGRAVALCLAEAGASVFGCARGGADLDAAAATARARGLALDLRSVDVTDQAQVARLLEEIGALRGRIDVLVNCAGGVRGTGQLWDLDEQAWLDTYRLNVLGPVLVIQAALPWLRRAAGARVVNLTSTMATAPGAFNPHYAASKAALLNLTRQLAQVLAPAGIRVNAVSPGPVRTEGLLADPFFSEERVAARVPLGRIGEPEEVAALVRFLVSQEARYITGAHLRIDGGKTPTIF